MDTDIINIYKKTLSFQAISKEEALYIYTNSSTSELAFIANEIRKQLHKHSYVGWIIDRNMNITNICVAGCKFCNFHRRSIDSGTYITPIEEYREKIKELFSLGGNQLLLQGGLHPKLGLKFYSDLFKQLKQEFPELKLHALGPPEIVHIAKIEKTTYSEVLNTLIDSGLDSLPGAGAEILNNEIRKTISPGKCDADSWLNVMREAHKINLPTSATMMFGHIETPQQRIEHLLALRQVQEEKPENAYGFISFIPWPFQSEGTVLKANYTTQLANTNDYIRLIAISRIVLNNIKNIQASWLTVGKQTGMLSLHCGANDLGSIMIEENVVSVAGAKNKMNAQNLEQTIIDAGFIPRKRNQKYEFI